VTQNTYGTLNFCSDELKKGEFLGLRSVNPHKFVPRTAEYLVAVTAAVVLTGWVSGVQVLTSVSSGLVSMKANTAMSFLLLAVAVHCESLHRNYRCQKILALVIVVLCTLTLWQDVAGINLHIDEALFRDPARSLHPGRMAPMTAANFVLLAAAMLLPRFRWADFVKESLALLVALSSTFAVVGYLYGVPVFYGAVSGNSNAMAVHTGLSFLLLVLGFLFVERENGFVKVFAGPSIASMVARYMVPIAVLVPVGLGAVFIRSRWNLDHSHLVMALSVLSDVVLLVILIWVLAFMIQRVERERALVQHQADTDRLTGIYNRRFFDTSLESEIQRARRYGSLLSLILFDVDGFKHLNDRYGHLTGDRVLTRLVRECEASLRAPDVLCRYGGEEFAIIAPETTGEAGATLARRIREGVEAMRLEGLPEKVTISLGVAAWEPGFATNDDFIAAADSALYLAKNSGRNRECLYVRKTSSGEIAI
jgi:diguanylate cyclase (GGDEF)-like protein